MRKVLIIAGCIVALPILLVIALLVFVDVNKFRPAIQSQLEKTLHRSVNLGSLHLKVIPLSVRVDNVTVADAPEFGSQHPFVTSNALSVRVGLFALLKGQVQVDSLIIEQPSIELIKSKEGKWNASTIGEPSPSGGENDGKANNGTAISIAELRIDDGKIAVTDQATGKRSVYDHIDISLKNFKPGERFTLEAQAHLPGAGKQKITLEANGLPPGAGGLETADLNGKLSLDAVSLGALRAFLGTAAAGTPDAVFDGGCDFEAHSGTLAGKGSVKIQSPDFKEPLTLTYSVQHNLRDGVLSVPSLVAKLGAFTLDGKGELRASSTPPAVTADLRLNSAPMAEALRIGRLFGAPDNITSDGTITAQLHAQGTSSSPSLSGGVQISSLGYNLIVLKNVRATCKADNGVIHLDPLSAQLFGGQQTGSLTVDTKSKQTSLVLQSKLDKVDANQLMTAATSVKEIVYGSLSGNVDMRLLHGPSQDMAKGLNGTLQIQLNNGKLAGMHILNEVASIANILGYARRSEPYTNFLKLSGTLKVLNGVANTDDLRMDMDGASLSAVGSAGLSDQVLNMHVTAVLSKRQVELLGGQASGLMSTVLANNNGDWVIPATVTGTFAKPRFAPDAARFAQMKLKGLLPTADNPGGMVSKIQQVLGGKDKGKGLMDLIDSVTKK